MQAGLQVFSTWSWHSILRSEVGALRQSIFARSAQKERHCIDLHILSHGTTLVVGRGMFFCASDTAGMSAIAVNAIQTTKRLMDSLPTSQFGITDTRRHEHKCRSELKALSYRVHIAFVAVR